MIKKITFALSLISVLALSAHAFTFAQYSDAAKVIGKGRPVMLEVGAESCVNCKKMNEILTPIVARHPHYQIFDIILKAPAVNILDPRPQVTLEQKLNIHAIPTQIFYNGSGKEVYRHIGILDAGQLASIFKKLKF